MFFVTLRMISPLRSHQFRVAGSPGYSLPVFRGGAHPVWGLTAIITLQVRLPFSRVFFLQLFFLLSFCEPFSRARLTSIDSSSSPRSSCDGRRMCCETLLLWNIQRGGETILISVSESIRCETRMGAESSSLLSGVTIDSSPILTTQDWSLHHAQVNYSAPLL